MNTSPILLFGSRGLIGHALLQIFVRQGRPVVTLTMDEIRDQGIEAALDRALQPYAQSPQLDVLFANGVTDPTLSQTYLEASNVDFPKTVDRILKFQSRAFSSNFRVLTLGSVHEHFPEIVESNPYIRSKKRLAQWVQAQNQIRPAKYFHLQLHTVYGSRTKDHLFLGQMIQALKANQKFAMSSGDQLREYQHVNDVAQTISILLSHDWSEKKLGDSLLMSTGKMISLRELAQSIFTALGRRELLLLGTKSTSGPDNLVRHFTPSNPEWVGHYREPLAGVLSVVSGLLQSELQNKN